MTCPIGVPGIEGKEPEVIAIAVVAQLLQLQPTPVAQAGGATVSAATRAHRAAPVQEPRYVL
jgi:xanthine dehydrogenase accessory factor